VLPRLLAAAAAAWSMVYLVAYLWLIAAQDSALARWYVVLMVLARSASRSSWQLGARRTDCRTGHISPRHAGRFLRIVSRSRSGRFVGCF
jgi:hypothetical protein